MKIREVSEYAITLILCVQLRAKEREKRERAHREKAEVYLRVKNDRRVGMEKEGKMIFYLSTYKKQENALQIF